MNSASYKTKVSLTKLLKSEKKVDVSSVNVYEFIDENVTVEGLLCVEVFAKYCQFRQPYV